MKQAQYKEMIENEIKRGKKYNLKSVKIRPISQTGSGKYARYTSDHTGTYTKYLDSIEVKYTIGNDAVRGGKKGKYIEIEI